MFYWQCHVFPILHLFTNSRLFSVWNNHGAKGIVAWKVNVIFVIENKGKEVVRQWVKQHFEKKVPCYVKENISSYDTKENVLDTFYDNHVISQNVFPLVIPIYLCQYYTVN